MIKQNLPNKADEIEKKYLLKDEKNKKRMKVSGSGVKTLQRLIKNKT